MGNTMNKHELAQICVEIEKAGGSVRDYLHDIGFLSPWGTWYRLQIEELGRKKHQITEGKGTNNMAKKITLMQKKRAIQIALDGGNPLPFLRECGSSNPPGLWYTIKQDLKKVDPETYEKLPKRIGSAPAEETKTELEGFEPYEMKDGRRKAEKEETVMAAETKEFNGKIYEAMEKDEPEETSAPNPFFDKFAGKRLVDKDQFIRDLDVSRDIVDIITSEKKERDGFTSPVVAVIDIIRKVVEHQPEMQH